jgi:hypothetical protein
LKYWGVEFRGRLPRDLMVRLVMNLVAEATDAKLDR